MWLRLFLLLIRFARALLRLIEKRRALSELEADAARESLEASHAIIRRAMVARSAVMHDADSVRNDPRNRDQGPKYEDPDGARDPERRVRQLQ